MKILDKLEEKACERCGGCPFYYYDRGPEDCDEGCGLKGWDWNEGICLYMLLPRWMAKIRKKIKEYQEYRWYRKHEDKLKVIYKKCPYKSEDCNYHKCRYED